MRWALVTHPEHWRNGTLLIPPMPIAEHCVPAALGQGWVVLATDSDIEVTHIEMNLQSNPQRVWPPTRDQDEEC